MKKPAILVCVLLLLAITESTAQFITTWKTDNPGTSEDNQITITTTGPGYDYTVDWGDGSSNENVSGDIIHTYSVAGTYTVSITGNFPRIYFVSSGDNEKLLTVEQWGDNEWTSMENAFRGCSNLTIPATDVPDLSNVTSMSSMFRVARVFNQDISDWDVSNVTEMNNMFFHAEAFNQDIGDWDVSNVTNMYGMFRSANAFNQNINDWDVSNVTDMSYMFHTASKFNQYIGDWDVSSVTDMSAMFYNASKFNQDIGYWEVNNVNNMNSMFRNAKTFNQDISGWNVGKVTKMPSMFNDASSFNQDIGGWDISSVSSMISIFNGTSLTPQNYDQILISWSAQDVKSDVPLDASGITYCKSETARQSLIDNHGWGITDAGKFCLTEKDILSFDHVGQTGDAAIDTDNHTVEIEVIFSTDITSLTPTIILSAGATSSPEQGAEVNFTDPVIYTVTAEDGTTQDWTVTVNKAATLSTETDILSFVLEEQTGEAIIDATNHTVEIEVAFDTDISSLTPTITLSAGADISPESGEVIDFTHAVTYTVIAEDDIAEQDWTVTVTEAPNSATDILSFVLESQTGDAIIDLNNHTISIEVTYGMDITSLEPTITLSEGATINPGSGEAIDFTHAVTYTVTAEDDITEQDWTITVVDEANIETDILSFVLESETGDAIIDLNNHTVAIEVAYGTDISSLTPTITVSFGATVSTESEDPVDFTDPVTYTVVAEDDITEQDWTVTVAEALNTEADITSFVLESQTGEAIIDFNNHTVTIEVLFSADITRLTPTLTLSAGATSSPEQDAEVDFTNSVSYTITAEDGSTQAWMVTVTKAAALSAETDILSFVLEAQTGEAIIDLNNHTVVIEVAYGTDMTSLTPTITVSEGAAINPASGEVLDFTDPVTYTVIAEDDITEQGWTVTVTEAGEVLNAIEQVALSIWPNPTSAILHVRSDQQVSAWVISLTGQLVVPEKTGVVLAFDLTPLSAGIYQVMVWDGEKVVSHRIIKEL